MSSRKLLPFILLILSLVFAACAAPATPAPTAVPQAAPTQAPAAAQPTAAPAADQGSLAVVLTGPWEDHSWNQAAYMAVQALGKKGVKIAYSDNVADADAARVLRQYADQGFKMVVADSFSYQDATFQVAKEYPKVNFAWAGGIQRMETNVADYDQPFYEAAYPIGVLAGYMSKSGVLGALYGFDIPVCHSMGEALLAGAKTINPKATLIQTAVGDWVDVAKAKEAALAQADAKVDFWIECGEGPALGAIEAAKEKGGYVTGYVGDMSADGPAVVLSNLVWNMEPLFAQMLKDTQAGTFNKPWYRFGIAEGAMQVSYNEALKSKIPAEAVKAVDQTMADIAAGKVKVEFVPQAAAAQPTAAPAADQGSLAVVLTGPWEDHSWNQAAYMAVQALGKKGVKIAYSDNVADADAARVLRQYADQGFKMVVADSFSYQDATFQVAKEYPKVNFAWAGGIQRMETNVADYDQPFYEAAYPIGVLAGYMSKSGVLGALYGFDIPVCHSMGEALLAGAKTINPKATLIQTAVGDWVDVAKAKEAALAQADAKVDFWIECGEGPALGAIEAAKEKGGYVTGYVGDMSADGPAVVLSNLVWNMEPLFAQMLKDTQAGTFNKPWYRFGIAEGAMQVSYNEALKSKIPAEAVKAVDQTMADIAAGKVKVEFVPEAKK